MIKNNLAKLMIDRNIKATAISNETGIARSTISRLSNNNSEKIDLSILNSLCTILKITPEHFFEYSPIDYSFTFEVGDLMSSDSEIRRGEPMLYEIFGFINYTKYNEKWISVEYSGDLEVIFRVNQLANGEDVDGIHVTLKPYEDDSGDINQPNLINLSKAISEIPMSFESIIKGDFSNFIEKKVIERFDNPYDEFSYNIKLMNFD